MHEVSKPIFFWKNKKNIINLSSAQFAQRVVKVNFQTLATYFIALDKSRYQVNIFLISP